MHTLCAVFMCGVLVSEMPLTAQTELSISSEAIAHTLAGQLPDGPQPRESERFGTPPQIVPDLTKVNSSSEMHVVGFDEVQNSIGDLEQQLHAALTSLEALTKSVHGLKHTVDNRLADYQKQVTQLKDQTRDVHQSMALTGSTTQDHVEVSGGSR